MIKLLINCSFVHYPNGTYVKMPMFALILSVPDTEDRVVISGLIYNELILLGFRLLDKKHFKESDIYFTAQVINIKN